MTPEFFFTVGMEIVERGKDVKIREQTPTNTKRFRSFFGTDPEMCSRLWFMCEPQRTMPDGAKQKHLMWALLFLKLYLPESVNCRLAGVDEKLSLIHI